MEGFARNHDMMLSIRCRAFCHPERKRDNVKFGIKRRRISWRTKRHHAISAPPASETIAALLAEPEIQLIMLADRVDQRELLATLSAIGLGLREVQRASDAEAHESSIDPSEYRPGVGIVLLNQDKHVFVGRRIGATENPWQMPQGGIDAGKGPLEAALRELAEEIGTNDVEVVAETRSWLHYELPAEITKSQNAGGEDAGRDNGKNGS